MNTELAWAAGFFDGEGWTSENSQAFTLGISQKDRRPLTRFVEAVGQPTNIHNNRLYTVAYCGAKALLVLEVLWPYLSEPKKEQARERFQRAYESRRRIRRFPALDAAYEHTKGVIGE